MKHLKNINLLLLSALLTTACSNEETPEPTINPANDPEAVELGITAGVALTKSAINSGTPASSETNGMKSLAVYAKGEAASNSSYDTDNNYAVYTLQNSSETSNTDKWLASSTVNKHIYLTDEKATIYAYHPAFAPDANGAMQTSEAGAKLEITSNETFANSTINVSVFQGSDSGDESKFPALATINNANNTWNSTDWSTSNSNSTKIISAPGEVDYMWAENNASSGSQATANNGKGVSAPGASVALKMKHALSMVSFLVYNDGTYNKPGNLTKIVLKNKDSNTDLSTGIGGGSAKPTMKIGSGDITPGTGTPAPATYTRTFTDTDGYKLMKVVSGTNNQSNRYATDESAAQGASAKFSILVLPTTTASKANIEAVFTIDAIDYSVPLGDSGMVSWSKGANNLYTIKLSGKELVITSVTVDEWSSATGGNLGVN
ncbi:fimbrillin family protein [Parabacteroides sp.]